MNAHQRRVARRCLERLPMMRGELGAFMGYTIITSMPTPVVIKSAKQMVEVYGQPNPGFSLSDRDLFDAVNPPSYMDVQRGNLVDVSRRDIQKASPDLERLLSNPATTASRRK